MPTLPQKSPRPHVPALLLAAALAGCAPGEGVVLHPPPAGPESLADLLEAYPADPARNLTPHRLAGSGQISLHLVHVADREPPHAHASHDLVARVVRGRGRLVLIHGPDGGPYTGTVHRAARGDSALVPRGTVHWFVNEGGEAAAALAVFAPAFAGQDRVPRPEFSPIDRWLDERAPGFLPFSFTVRRGPSGELVPSATHAAEDGR